MAVAKTIMKYTTALFATYMVAWTISYIYMFLSRGDGLDFTYYLKYFVMAWTFNAGELPSFIWLFSLLIFLPLAALLIFLMRKLEKNRQKSA